MLALAHLDHGEYISMFEQKSSKETSKRPAGREDRIRANGCQANRPHCLGKIHVSVCRSHQREHRIQAKRVENYRPGVQT